MVRKDLRQLTDFAHTLHEMDSRWQNSCCHISIQTTHLQFADDTLRASMYYHKPKILSALLKLPSDGQEKDFAGAMEAERSDGQAQMISTSKQH